jgi:hypothetical protein
MNKEDTGAEARAGRSARYHTHLAYHCQQYGITRREEVLLLTGTQATVMAP